MLKVTANEKKKKFCIKLINKVSEHLSFLYFNTPWEQHLSQRGIMASIRICTCAKNTKAIRTNKSTYHPRYYLTGVYINTIVLLVIVRIYHIYSTTPFCK